ncbi:unnamed protein product [Thlaspi arvense]|uniref:Uncharacterized protein n=1 Tax=Thlaspi arvense TaxID=13288 RepID=A0AAU9RQ65_THLAR|nr:unnamed protein product [Thlaspi arvense]
MEKMKQHWDMVGFVAAGQYGILRRCPCGGSIKHDVSPSPKFKHDFDTQPGSRMMDSTFVSHGFSESNKRLRS